MSFRLWQERQYLPAEEQENPYVLMKNSVKELLSSQNIWRDDLVSEIPKSWVKYGDMAVVGSKCFLDPIWKVPGDNLWTNVCAALRVKGLARSSIIKPDSFRTPCVEMLYGNNGWVTAMDAGNRYSWDVSLCMFSPVNGTERCRIAAMNCEGETVVDLYAGIGYFTLTFLLFARAEFVHACERNPAAVKALRYNLKKSNVLHNCCIHEGDNKEVCPRNVADRVNMGLLPSCKPGIETACKALKSNSGGVLHLHENVSSYREKFSVDDLTLSSVNTKLEYMEQITKLIPDLTCLKCRDILLTYPKILFDCSEGYMRDVYDNNDTFRMSFCLEGSDGEPEWCETSPIVWKKSEWFLRALHLSHIICGFLSTFHESPWKVEIVNFHHVKSYAPHVDHLVFDIKCSPLK